MSRVTVPTAFVGNEFIVPVRLRVASPVAPSPAPVINQKTILDELVIDIEATPARQVSGFQQLVDWMHRYSLGVFAVLLLLVTSGALQVGQAYWTAHHTNSATPVKISHSLTLPVKGPNAVIKDSELEAKLQTITSQPLSIMADQKSVAISSETIRGWLQLVNDKQAGVTYLHVNKPAISKSLSEIAAPYAKEAVNQVTVTYADGTSKVIADGRNGSKIGDLMPLADQIAPTLLSAKGLQLNLPIETVAFAAVTPTAFDKLIEVNVNSKQMWLYDKGQLTKTYPISAGAAATPTPIGQYKIYSKLAVQDMKGFNPNGSKYFQPHVRWINYFLPGGYAVHGNYWRPLSWFGAVNSSHGCVSLPDDQAKEVYDWAPIGTTVITHY